MTTRTQNPLHGLEEIHIARKQFGLQLSETKAHASCQRNFSGHVGPLDLFAQMLHISFKRNAYAVCLMYSVC